VSRCAGLLVPRRSAFIVNLDVRLRSVARRHRLRSIAVLGGAAFALATPPTNLLALVFVGLAAYVVLVARVERARDAFGLGWLWATCAGLVGMRFVPPVIVRFTPLGWGVAVFAHLLFSALQALPWGIGAAAAQRLYRRHGAPLELAAAIATLVATSLPTVIPWTPASLLSPWPVLLQAADVIGERGLSALFAAWAASVVRGVALAIDSKPRSLRRGARPLVATLLGALLLAGHGLLRRTAVLREPTVTTRIGLVTGAAAPELRWEPTNWPQLLADLRRETAFAETAGVDLTVWPEAAYPYPLRHDTRAMPRGQREILGGAIDGPVLFGFIASAPKEARGGAEDAYNSATIVRTDRTLTPSYDKVELLAFGETIPFGEQIPWLRETFQRGGGLRPGSAPRRLDVDVPGGATLRLGVLNCYEDTLPSYGRRIATALEPNLLVNVTNDAWFVGTSAPELHLRLSALRAIELRRDLVRAVNLGPSAWIDATGTLRAVRRSSVPDYVVATPSLRQGPPTFYARSGEAPIWLALGVLAAWFARHSKARS